METKKNITTEILLFVVILFAACIFAVLAGTVFTAYFTSNDDMTLLSIMSGAYTGTPDGHLIYIMYPLGYIFKSLYSLLPNILWYELFTVFMHILCVTVCTYRLSFLLSGKRNLRILSMVLFFLLFETLDLKFSIENQYTTLSAVISATAVFLSALLFHSNKKTKRILQIIVILILETVSLWIRKEAFFMSLPFLAVALLFSYCMDRLFAGSKEEKVIKPGFLFDYPVLLFSMLFMVSLSFVIEKNAYKDPAWETYKEFNRVRSNVFDYDLLPKYKDNVDFYESIGIDDKEYTAITEYNLSFIEGLDTALLQTLAARQNDVLKEWKQFYSVPRKLLKDTAGSVWNNLKSLPGAVSFLFSIGCILYVLLFGRRGKIKALQIFLFTLVFLYNLAFYAYFSYLQRLPERVTFGMDHLTLITILAISIRTFLDPAHKKKIARYVISTAFICAALVFSVIDIGNGQDGFRKRAKDSAYLNAYIDSHEDKILLISQYIYGSSSKTLFKDHFNESIRNVKEVDWAFNSPLREEKLRRLGLKEDISILLDEKVEFAVSQRNDTEWLLDLVNQDRDSTYRTETVESFGDVNILKILPE